MLLVKLEINNTRDVWKFYIQKNFTMNVLNFPTNFRNSEQSSERLGENLTEIDCNISYVIIL